VSGLADLSLSNSCGKEVEGNHVNAIVTTPVECVNSNSNSIRLACLARQGTSPNPGSPMNIRRRAFSSGSKKALHLGWRAPESVANASGKLDPKTRKESYDQYTKYILHILCCQYFTDSAAFEPSRLYVYGASSEIEHRSAREAPNWWAQGQKSRLNLVAGGANCHRARQRARCWLPNERWSMGTNNDGAEKFFQRHRPMISQTSEPIDPIADLFEGMPKILTAKHVGAALGISHKTVYEMAKDGRMPVLPVAGTKFVKQRIINWLREQDQPRPRQKRSAS
jgi:predicted DNA-binding transcriptional regulator AlpA